MNIPLVCGYNSLRIFNSVLTNLQELA